MREASNREIPLGEVALGAVLLRADQTLRPLVNKTKALFVDANKSVEDFFGKEEVARRLRGSDWADDEARVRALAKTDNSIQELAKSRAARLKAFTAGFLVGALSAGSIKNRLLKGSASGAAAVIAYEITANLPPTME
jgi:hypothetical protein